MEHYVVTTSELPVVELPANPLFAAKCVWESKHDTSNRLQDCTMHFSHGDVIDVGSSKVVVCYVDLLNNEEQQWLRGGFEHLMLYHPDVWFVKARA